MNSNEDEMLNSIRILSKRKKKKKISVERLNPRKIVNYKEILSNDPRVYRISVN